MTSETVLAVAAAVFGAVVGSFLNVVIYRLPRGDFFRAGRRSVCANPECGAPVPSYLNLPILGWLVLRGRARCCGYRLSLRYPLVEALTAALFFWLWTHPPHLPPVVSGGIAGGGLFEFAVYAYFVSSLVANSFIDIDHRILPDVLTKSTMVVGVAGALISPGLAGRFEASGIPPAMDSVLFSAVGLLAGLGLTQGIRKSAQALFRKEAMGFGDVKLMGAIGAFLGWQGVLLTFFVGCLLGAVVGIVHRALTKDAYICFGPFLAGGALITLFAGDRVLGFFTALQHWQQSSATAPWVVSSCGVVSVFLLILLVRQGRK